MDEPLSEDRTAEAFLDRAPQRVLRLTLIVEAIALLIFSGLHNWLFALGIAIGAASAYLNLHWLHGATTALAERLITRGAKSQRFRFSWGFLGRYAFLALVGYVIFRSSLQVLYGFLLALTVPVVALMCEAVYEALHSVNDRSQ